jgi:hypothetical protein
VVLRWVVRHLLLVVQRVVLRQQVVLGVHLLLEVLIVLLLEGVLWLLDVTIPGIRASRPDRPGQTKTRSTAHMAMRQKRYDKSTFSARLAEAL